MQTSNGKDLLNGLELTSSMSSGANGGLSLADFTLLDHLAHFDRERIPERVVHAKGAGAFGYFQTTCSQQISQICKAKLFQTPGKKTPIAIRFSTVGGESGSADTVRDPRGFAVKFYTEEGNWDLVGNNTPIFFLRDPILFPSFIHTQKRNPSTHLPDPNAFWDFISLRPETTHQVSFLFSDRGIPDGYRHMNGYGSHTFINTNDNGEQTYVKYHFKTDQGIRNLSVSEASELRASNPDYAMQDLYDAIARKEYPTWTLYVQCMTLDESRKLGFDACDVTKIWPHSKFPLIEVGKLVLNRNPTNYFAEIEQLAFSPAHFISGISASRDKMLQGRLFSYSDTHRHRLGVNYQQIPVNQPLKTPVTYQRDGVHTSAAANQYGNPNYFPNSFDHNKDLIGSTVIHSGMETNEGFHGKYCTKDSDNFGQCGEFYSQVLSEEEKSRLVENLATHLSGAKRFIQERVVQNFSKAHTEFGQRIELKLQEIAQKPKKQTNDEKTAKKLSPPRSKSFVPDGPEENQHPRL